MLNLKKTAVAVLAFGSSAVFAGTMGPVCTPGNVTVPCESTAWDFGAKALYLKPGFAGAPYVGVTTAAGASTYQDTPNDWDWGFMVEGSYHYSTGNDVNLNWYHYSHTTSRSLPAGFIDLNAATYGTGIGFNHKPRWDAVNLEFGQHVDFAEMKSIRFHAGLQYANLKSDTTFSSTTVAAGVIRSSSTDIKYDGIGPRFGMDPSWDWGNGFSIYGNAAGALLVGRSKFNGSTVTGTGVTTSASGSHNGAIVPELEGKLGIKYSFAMAQGDLSVDAGWMWVNYFNALGAAFAPTAPENRTSDFSVQGPYIGLKWVGNVA